MNKIKLTTDSTCDLSPELLKKYDIDIMPLFIMLGENEYEDNGQITLQNLFDFVKESKKLPKTAARNEDDFKEFFRKYTNQGYDVVHIGISTDLSLTTLSALKVSEDPEFKDKVFVVDGRSLSTGTSLLLLHAAGLIEKGKTAKQIQEIAKERAEKVQASFVIENLDYLHKGGRCSSLKLLGANLLKLRPELTIHEGKIINTGKYRGKMNMVYKKYIDEILVKFSNPDKARCFITHTVTDEPELVKEVVEYVKAKNIFDEVLDTYAGCTIATHCGKGTLGILFINDGGRR